jgi:hypothetical protein
LSFVDMAGHGYAVVRASADAFETEFVCIPRPLEPAATRNGGPMLYLIVHRAPLWTAGERPRLRQMVLEGDRKLSIQMEPQTDRRGLSRTMRLRLLAVAAMVAASGPAVTASAQAGADAPLERWDLSPALRGQHAGEGLRRLRHPLAARPAPKKKAAGFPRRPSRFDQVGR